MSDPTSSPGQYRHVVFPDLLRRGGRVLNYAPSQPELSDAGPVLSDEEDAWVRRVFRQAGLEWRHYKPESMKRRLPACWRALRVGSAAQARLLLQREPAMLQTALDAMLIGVTGFFRDAAPFAFLRDKVIPDFVACARTVRAWSAGCSDGSELYSLAILLAERGALYRSFLLGTDCRAQAVRRAGEGVFDLRSVEEVPAGLRERYFRFESGQASVAASLREAATWRPGDVLQAAEPAPWDIILCRNLAIYLQHASASALWKRLAATMRVGGVLVLGKAERPAGVRGLAPIAPMIYRWEGD